MRKGTKSNFLSAMSSDLQEGWKETHDLPTSNTDIQTAYIVDAMAFVQRFRNMNCSTFGEMSEKYLQQLNKSKPGGCSMIHVVSDRYDVPEAESLKYDERQRRT